VPENASSPGRQRYRSFDSVTSVVSPRPGIELVEIGLTAFGALEAIVRIHLHQAVAAWRDGGMQARNELHDFRRQHDRPAQSDRQDLVPVLPNPYVAAIVTPAKVDLTRTDAVSPAARERLTRGGVVDHSADQEYARTGAAAAFDPRLGQRKAAPR